MIDPKERIAVYCPTCGKVLFPKIDSTGAPILKSSFCSDCNTIYQIIEEPLCNFFILSDDLIKGKYLNDKYVFEKFIKQDPRYNKEAHVERLKTLIQKNADAGHTDEWGLLELKELCGIEMEQPEVNPEQKSYFVPSKEVRCPRCGSTSITTQKKGFGVGKAAAGVLAVGLAGALAGGIGANKAVNVCAKCGHKWNPGGR